MIKKFHPPVFVPALLWIALSLWSACKTLPPAENRSPGETGASAPLAEAGPSEDAGPALETGSAAETGSTVETGPAAETGPLILPGEEASVFLPPGELFAEGEIPLIEPFPDTPEADSPSLPPPEPSVSVLFPEPFPPDLSPMPEFPPETPPEIPPEDPAEFPMALSPPSVPGDIPPSPGTGALSPSPPETAPPPPVSNAAPVPETPPSPASPPEPPRFLRPAEPESSPGISREPVPLPVNSPPVLPPSVPPRIPEGEDIVYSRIVRATVGQLVEIPFRGTGWVYLGELGSRRGISYDSRRLDPEGQSFIFRAETAGTYGLKFYKQDFIRDYILNDHVQVIVGEAPAVSGTGWFNPPIDRGRVIADPRWPVLPDTGAAPGSASGTEPPRAGSGAAPNTAAGGTSAANSGSAPGTAGEGSVPNTAVAGGSAAGSGATPNRAAAGGSVPGAEGGSSGDSPAPAGSTAVAAGQGEPAGSSPAVSAAPSGPPPAQPPRPVLADDGIVAVVPPAAVAPAAPSGAPAPDTTPEGYLRRAREEFDAGRIGSALSVLDQFRERYPSGSDEAWWLYGQLFEANGANRDIRSALDYYRRLIREFPQSSRYAEARRRIAYLERYYFNIP